MVLPARGRPTSQRCPQHSRYSARQPRRRTASAQMRRRRCWERLHSRAHLPLRSPHDRRRRPRPRVLRQLRSCRAGIHLCCLTVTARQRNGRMVDLITSDELIPQPHELVLRNGTPDTIAGWKALADGLLTDQSCVFHRNLEISSRYAWIYSSCPPASSGPGWPRSRRTTSGSPSFRSGWTPIAPATWTSRTASVAGRCC